jgi:hypothetical protein
MTSAPGPRSKAGAALLLACMVSPAAGAPADNAVLRWNAAALQAVRNTRDTPVRVTRALAILHTCIYRAWVTNAPALTGAAARGAVSAAAHLALSDLYPTQRALLFDPLARQLGALDARIEPRAAERWRASCRAVLDERHHDGANQLGDLNGGAPYSDYTGYVPVNTPEQVNDPNRWQPLRSAAGEEQLFAAPHWSRVAPFALRSADQFRPPAPPLAGTPDYLRQARDLVALSAGLDDERKAIAVYWADGPATETPAGHWNLLAAWVSRRDRHRLEDDVRLFFILNNALLDASIAVWDAKRFFDYVRPITAIRYLFAGQTINAWAGPGLGTQPIAGERFTPYVPTPPFAEYTSGHSAFSAAAARVLELFTGSPRFGASAIVAAGSSPAEPGLAPAADVLLTWPTFAEAAAQAGLSRRYGGIHFEGADLRSRSMGRAIADQVWRKASRLPALTVR